MPRTLLAVLLLLVASPLLTRAAEITPSDVYVEALRIEGETSLLKRHFNIVGEGQAPVVEADLKPRHVWAKSYMLQIKISLLRRQKGLMYVEPAYLEPSREIDPSYVWEQTQRILAEIAILKRQLEIPGQPPAVDPVHDMRPTDVFNKLNQISYDWSLLLGGHLTPDHVYGEAMRIHEDVNTLLRLARIVDNAPAPKKNLDSTPSDSLDTAFEILAEVQGLQRQLNIATVELRPFRGEAGTTPEDVFNLLGMVLAEMQTIKAQRGLVHAVTPGAYQVQGKGPAEVQQLLGYVLNKIRLIRAI